MIPAFAVFAPSLHAISWKFLPAYALGLCPSHDFPIPCESHFKTGFFIAEKVVDALRLINRSKKRDGIALKYPDFRAMRLKLMIQISERLSNKVPVPPPVVRIF